MDKNRKKEILIIIIGIIHIVASIAYLTLSIITLTNPAILLNVPDFSQALTENQALIFYFSIALIILALIYLLVGIGIFFHNQIARYAAIILSLMLILGGLISLVEKNWISAISLIFNLFIFSYLIFSKKVRNLFIKKKKASE